MSPPSIKVRNASQAVDTALSYLRQRESKNTPDAGIKWQEKTIYSTGIQDYAVTSKLFTAGDWAVDVSQGVAPLSITVYQVTLFSAGLCRFWQGSVRADGDVSEVSAFRLLSREESHKMAEELSRKIQVPPPKPGGYGH